MFGGHNIDGGVSIRLGVGGRYGHNLLMIINLCQVKTTGWQVLCRIQRRSTATARQAAGRRGSRRSRPVPALSAIPSASNW